MTTISYLTGKTVQSRQSLLLDMLAASKNDSFLHIVSTRGRVMELETDPRFWLNRRVNTLSGIIHQIFDDDIRSKSFSGYSPVDRFLQSILIKKALENRGGCAEELLYFRPIFCKFDPDMDFPGIYRNIARFFSILVCNNYEDIFANDLGGKMLRQEERIPGSGDEKYALESDLLWLLGDYEELKRELKVYDEDDILKNVRDFLKAGGIPSYTGDTSVLILDGLTHLTRIEEDILFHLSICVDELWLLLDQESELTNPVEAFKEAAGREGNRDMGHDAVEGKFESCRIFYPLISLIERLEEKGVDSRIVKGKEYSYPNPFAGILYAAGDVKPAVSNTIRIRSFPGEVEEVRAIASEIKRIVHENNPDISHDLGSIRVIFPDLNDYSSIISEIFTEYSLPFSLTKGIPLSTHPLSHLFIKIFELCIHGFERKDLFSFFSSEIINPEFFSFNLPEIEPVFRSKEFLLIEDDMEGLFRMFTPERLSGIQGRHDIHLFDTGALRCGIDHLGYKLENIDGERLMACREMYSGIIQETRDHDEKKAIRQEYYLFIYQCEILKYVLAPFTDIPEQGSTGEILESYKNVLRRLGFPVNILNLPADNHADPQKKRRMLKRDVRAFTLLNDLLITCRKEADISGRLFGITDNRNLLVSFYKTFKNRITSTYLLDERNPNVIRVSQWLETRGRSFDYVFAGGLTANRFPLKEEHDFIIPEASRGVFRIIDPVDQSKYLFTHLLKNYKKGLFISYPGYIAEKPVQPSPVIQDLCALAEETALNNSSELKSPGDFTWENNPYFTSENELLDAGIPKTGAQNKDRHPDMKNIITGNPSSEDDIIRSIKALVSRYAKDGLYEYDGLVGGASEFPNFIKSRGNVFSSSGLETLANCPMKYLFKYILKVKRLDDIAPVVSPRDMGKHIHHILSLFYGRLIDLNTNIAGIGIEKAFNMAMEMVDDYLARGTLFERLEFAEYYKEELFAGLAPEAEYGGGQRDIREGVFASLIRFEDRNFRDRLPQGVEFEFGTGKDPIKSGDIFLRGYIDRFDIDTDFPDRIYLYDYKTGGIKSSKNIKKGLSFQLPVYINAIGSKLKKDKISAAFYSLKRKAFLEDTPLKYPVDHNIGDKGLDTSGVTLTDDFIKQLISLLDKGMFHHSTDFVECSYCEFRYACQKDERRMEYLLDTDIKEDIYSGEKNLKRWQEVDDFRKKWKKITESMTKAHTLKTESARQRHFEAVLEFRDTLNGQRNDLPFKSEYIDGLLEEIDRFERQEKMIDMT